MWGALYTAWIISEVGIFFLTRTRRTTPGYEDHDRGSLFTLWFVILVGMSIGSWYSQTHAPDFFRYSANASRVGIALLLTGFLIRWLAILKLGRRFTVNVVIQQQQQVEKTGIFRLMRHPSYTGLLLIFFAVALNTRSWIGAALVLVPVVLALVYRIHVEEAALNNAFGEEYRSYCRSTKRLIPGVF